MHPTLNIALRAANAAAEKLIYTREHWATLTEESGTGKAMDQLHEGAGKRVYNTIHKAHPDHTVECVQTGTFEARDANPDVVWQADLLLGDTNYTRGLSDVGVLVSQWHKGRMEHLTLVFPFLSTEVMASRGRGIQINGRRVRTGNADRLNGALTGTSMDTPIAMARFVEQGASVRISGCALLDISRLAAGQLDLIAHTELSPLEVAAAQLLATESGAVTGDFTGKPVDTRTRELVSANPKLLRVATKVLRQA